jgi:S-adenosylmethionine/arginine decarboxylase-like enzyme
MYWGYHLIIDISQCNAAINSVESVTLFIKELVSLLKMHQLGSPLVVYISSDEGKGVSAAQIITTSTITFHGDEDENCAFIDVFSCKEYDHEVVLECVKRYFAPRHVVHTMVYRNAPTPISP